MRSSMYIGIERIYSLAARVAVSAFIQDPLTVDLVINAPALTSHGVAIARDRLRHLSIKRTSGTGCKGRGSPSSTELS